MELGRLTASFEANTRDFDTKLKASEVRLESLKASIKSAKAEASSPFKAARLDALKTMLGQATKEHRALQIAHRETAKSAQGAANALNSDLGGALGNISPRLAAFAGAGGPISLAIAGFAATAIGVGLLGKALYDVAVTTADFQGKLFDLSQQTGVSVETLSALDVMAATTGSDIGAVAASLGIFQKNLEAARDPTDKLAQTFRTLGVETENTEDALRQSLKQLAKMPEDYHQTAVAMQLFGRGGKAILAILKEMGGDLDATMEKLDKMGILIKTGASKAADEFNDKMVFLDRKLKALAASIGTQVMPAVERAIDSLSAALDRNKEAIQDLAQVASALSVLFTGPLRGAIGVVEGAMWALHPAIRGAAELYERAAAAAQLFAGVSVSVDANGIPALPVGDLLPAQAGASGSIGAGILRKKRPRTGGGGSRGGGRTSPAAKEEPDDSVGRFLDDFHKQLAEGIEEAKQKQRELIDEILGTPVGRIQVLIDLYETMREAAEAGDALLVGPGGVDTATRDLERLIEMGAPENTATEAVVAANERMREAMNQLGADVTDIWARAVGDGFEQGAKRGLQTLAQGLLSIVQDVFLKRLAEGMGNIFSSAGGGWLQKLLGIGLGAAGGAAGGGGGGKGIDFGIGGGWAKGGVVPGDYKGYDSVPAMLSPGETVIPRGGKMGQQVVNHFTIQLPPVGKGGYASPESKRQMAAHLVAALQGAQT